MGVRNNSKRNREQESKEKYAKKSKTIQDKITRPKVCFVDCLHAASSSTNQIEVSDSLENTPSFLALRSFFRPMSEAASEHLDLTPSENLSTIGSRLASLNQDIATPSFTGSNKADEALDAEHSSSSSVDDEEDEPPSIRNLRRNPLRTKAGAEFFENEVPQVKKKIRQSNKRLARERSEKTAAKKARKAELDRYRVILDIEIPTKHTVKCTAGWMWSIDIGNAYTSEHSLDTFECWKVRVPQESDLVMEQVPVLIN